MTTTKPNTTKPAITKTIDKLYPESKTIKGCPFGMWQMQLAMKLRQELEKAKAGDRKAESYICH